MKKIISILSAPYIMGALLPTLAAVMGLATFVENDFGTNAAKALYYNTWWFEGIFVVLGINMFFNIFKPQLWKKGKLPIALFHTSFFLIIVGAALTRYIGYEGMMHIREGEATNEFLSLNTYVDGIVEKDGETKSFSEHVFMSEKSKDNFKSKVSIKGASVKLASVDYIQKTKFVPVESTDGKPLLSLVVSGMGGRRDVDLFLGESVKIGAFEVGFGVDRELDFNIYPVNDQLMLATKHHMFITDMGTQQKSELDTSVPQPFYSRTLYGTEGFFIVRRNYMEGAILKPVAAERNEQGDFMESLVVKLQSGTETRQLTIQGHKDMVGMYDSVQINGLNVKLRYGAKVLEIPFDIHLNDFQLERYPGSKSPSSFASEVTLLDHENGVKKDYRIFMNNILNYKGFRFYQSSYDMDEKGTVLSVNNDFWGTLITYIGYFVMAVTMIWSLFASKSRFQYLGKKVTELGQQRKALVLIMALGSSVLGYSQNIDDVIKISKDQGEKFGELWVLDNAGRFKPMNSLTGELLRKLVKHNSYKGYSSDVIVLSILSNPDVWKNIPLITVKDEPLKEIVGNRGKKAAFSDFFGASGNYKLHEVVEEAYRTKPAYRSKLQNEIIKVDEQVNVFYLTQSSKLLKVFPDPSDSHQPWMIPGEYQNGMSEGDSLFVRNIFSIYLEALRQGNEKEASTYIDAISKYQHKFGAEVLPSQKVKEVEIFYNKTNLFLLIAPVLFVLGFILLIIHFVFLFLPEKSPYFVNYVGFGLLVLSFVVYTLGMALRWYIAGHAPWSNGYESMLLIGWAILLAGVIFSRKSDIIISIACIFSGIVLFVAHLSWMNPEVTNLVPVLKSYWLTIHVAVLVSSYGFLGIGSLIGFFNLLLTGLRKNKSKVKVDLTVSELTHVMEMSLTVGLYLLTIGSFLGGVWANESWGRYWGWDPKETWSLVTVMVYAFILHMRFIPGLRGIVLFNTVSVVGFFFVIMTYLGVNYYLAGMHSYAKGDPMPIPDFVYYIVITVFVVVGYAFYNSRRLNKE